MLPGRLDQRDIPIPVFLRLSTDRAQNRTRLRIRRGSFEKAKDEVFECLKLGLSGTWESFHDPNFQARFASSSAKTR